MNRQNYGWIAFTLLAIVIVIVIFWPKGCGCSQFSQKGSDQDSSIAQLLRETKEALDSCKNAGKGGSGSSGNSYSYFYSTTPKNQEPKAPSTKETPSPKNEEPAPKPEVKKGSSRSLDPSYYEGDRNIYFCLNYDHNPAWYLPHLAIANGEGIQAIQNNQGGYNWVVSDAQLAETLGGDWGVTRDGVFFVSCALVDRNNPGATSLFILTTASGWAPKPMIKSGSYYIWKR